MGKQSTPEQPQPAPFFPIDIEGTGDLATQTDINAFRMADEDFAARFPGLVAGRDQDISNAYRQLTGPLDPTVQNAFVNEGLEKAFSAFGTTGGGITDQGGIGRKTISSSVAGNVQRKQDYDRAAFSNLFTTNLPRAFGLSGSDAANLSIANTGNLNATTQSNYIGQVQAQNVRESTDAANQQAALQAGLAVAGIIAVIA